MRVSVSSCKIRRVCAAIFAVAGMLASSCGPVSELEKSSRDQAEEVSQELAKLLGKGEPRWSSVHVSKRPWLGIEPVQREDREGLPPEFEGADAVTLPLSDIETDEVLASRIEAAAKLEVRLLGRASRETIGVGFVSKLSDGWTPAAGIWTGPLGRLLDVWSAAGGYEWRYLEGRVEVVRRKTVTFGINALAGSQNYSAQTATRDRASGEGAAGSARQALSTRAEFNPWPEIRGQLEQLVGPDAELAVSSGSATVTVEGTPEVIARVRGYLRHLSRVVLRPLTISAHVYVVRLQREADYEVGIAALIDRIFGERLQIDIGAGSIAVVRPPDGAGGDTDTLSATLRALQSVGTTSRVLSADVPSLNGKPAQFYELLKTAYLKEISTKTTETGSETTLKPGEVSSGFALSYTARITAPDEVLVRLVASLRDRPTFAVFGTSQAQIQLPVYADRGVQATQRLRRGETLIVAGFTDRVGTSDLGGTFDEKVPLPDGHRRASGFRQEQVLLVTVDVGEPLGLSETSETEL